MRLVPGVLTAPSVIAAIDADGDGSFSAREERAYAQRVIDDLAITLDGMSVRPKLTSWSFPPPAQMREGLGVIHIEYDANLPHGGQNRSLVLANHHLSRQAVYLVNVLVPSDAGIRILGRKRNERQSLYELDYRQAVAVDAASLTPWGTVGVWLNGVQLASLFHLGMRHIAEGRIAFSFCSSCCSPHRSSPRIAAGACPSTRIEACCASSAS